MTVVDEPRSQRLPWHMRGSYAPVTEEVEAFDLRVVGALPDGLNGTYVRNGANPKHGPTSHWFAGDGMLHGLRVSDGRAEWYRNRWVRTKALDGVNRMDMSTGTFDRTVGLANTHVVRHAGRILDLHFFVLRVHGGIRRVHYVSAATLEPCAGERLDLPAACFFVLTQQARRAADYARLRGVCDCGQ